MICAYIRSSFLGEYLDMCSHKAYIIYSLGYQSEPNIKTVNGTTVHACLERLAILKKKFQETKEDSVTIEDEVVGKITVNRNDFIKPYKLSDDEVDEARKSMSAISIYKDCQKPYYGQVRLGVDFVEELTKRCYDYYTSKSPHKFTASHLRDCRNFVWLELDWNKGMFDPRLRKIVEPERRFDLEITEPWAAYDYMVKGKRLKGNLCLKGTVDLITEVDEDTIEVIDYKTGQRYNWGTKKEKTYEDLCRDKQLMMYYYALRQLYPQYKNIMFTIFFMRDGGPFTLTFTNKDMDKIYKTIKDTFLDVKANELPVLRDPTRQVMECAKFCDFSKIQKGGKSLCEYIHNRLKTDGMQKTTDEEMLDNFTFGVYSEPGT